MSWIVAYLGLMGLMLLMTIPIAKQRRLRLAMEPTCTVCDAPVEQEVCEKCGFDPKRADPRDVDRYIRIKAAEREYENIKDLFSSVDVDQTAAKMHRHEIAAFEYLDDFEELVDRLPSLDLFGIDKKDRFELSRERDEKRTDQALLMIRLEKDRLQEIILESLD